MDVHFSSLRRALSTGFVALAALVLTGFLSEAFAQSGSNTIAVRARGTVGGESITLRIDNSNVATWTLSTSYQTFNASTSLSGNVSVAFTNDNGNRDVQVDYIVVNGQTRQSENQTSNTGVWANGSCGGGSNSEWLHCNGAIGYGPASNSANSIVVRARGTAGTESVSLRIDNTNVATWTMSTAFQNFSASTNLTGAITVAFTNDATGRDVQVDYITVNGTTRQAEAQTYNTGVWANGSCGGGSLSEWMHCNGVIGFGNVSGGGGGGPGLPEFFVGNITTNGAVRSDFLQYWDQITPENEGKWASVEGTRDVYNWSGLDAAYNFAKQNNIPFKQHTFVWGSQQPGWVGGLSQAEQREEVEEWIRLFCERYPDTALIDVVNEPPPHTTPSYMAALGGAGASGYDWIVQAFRWANQYCPKAILILNDYNNIEYSADNMRMITIANAVKNAGAPIHAIGAQAHAAYNISNTTVKMYLDRLASQTNLPIYITEYDINVADDNQQRTVMENQFTMFWEHPNVRGITFWGYIVGSTWVANSGLMTSSGTMRPAMTWLMNFLGR